MTILMYSWFPAFALIWAALAGVILIWNHAAHRKPTPKFKKEDDPRG